MDLSEPSPLSPAEYVFAGVLVSAYVVVAAITGGQPQIFFFSLTVALVIIPAIIRRRATRRLKELEVALRRLETAIDEAQQALARELTGARDEVEPESKGATHAGDR